MVETDVGTRPSPGSALPSRESLLRWLARAAVLGSQADEVAVSSVLADGTLRLVHCTGFQSLDAERSQARSARGPAVTAVTGATIVTVPDLTRASQYPEVRVCALLGQVRSVMAVPIGGHGRINAVVDLWWTRRGCPTQAVAASIEHLQHIAAPILELIEQQDPAYRGTSRDPRLIGWDVHDGRAPTCSRPAGATTGPAPRHLAVRITATIQDSS